MLAEAVNQSTDTCLVQGRWRLNYGPKTWKTFLDVSMSRLERFSIEWHMFAAILSIIIDAKLHTLSGSRHLDF